MDQPTEDDDDDGNKDPNKKRKTNQASEADDAKIRAELAKLAVDTLTSAESGIGEAAIREPVRVGGKDLLLLLARYREGSVTILSSSNDADLINGVAVVERLDKLVCMTPITVQRA